MAITEIHSKGSNQFSWTFIKGRAPGSLLREKLMEEAPEFPSMEQENTSPRSPSQTNFTLSFSGETRWFVRKFDYTGFGARLKNTLTRNKARKEWVQLIRFLNTTVPVTTPIALGEQFQNGLIRRAIILTQVIEGTTPLHELLSRDRTRAGGIPIADRKQFWGDFSDFLETAVEQRAFPETFVPDAIQSKKSDGRYHFWLTRASEWRVGKPLSVNEINNLVADVLCSVVRLRTAWEGKRVYEILSTRGEIGSRLENWEEMIARMNKSNEDYIRRNQNNCVRQNETFTRSELGERGLFSWHRRDIDVDLIRELLHRHRNLDKSTDSKDVKRHSSGRISRHKTKNGDVMIKEVRAKRWKRKLQRLFQFSRSRRSWKHSHALRLRGFNTPRCIALVEPRRSLSRTSSYLFQEVLTGSKPLDAFIRNSSPDSRQSAPNRSEWSSLLYNLALFVKGLHQQGVYHGDLKASNILVRIPPGRSPQFYLIDLDRMKFFKDGVPGSKRKNNLAQLLAALPPVLTLTDRYRFWVTYRNASGFRPPDEKKFLRDLYRKVVSREEKWKELFPDVTGASLD